ncbi:hypothetical protein RJT34_04357 [Clitoria ternatea]|uniref:Uncharacterized protein n=1 Tax=Clitoria ternatea TaxID=43366 RepID=A0AAN9KLV3_CLITE
MGCCVSSNRTSTSPQKPPESNNRPTEEETVKEVLSSETPKWNPTTFDKSKPQKPLKNTNFNNFKEEGKVGKKTLSVFKGDDTSEVWSLSETMSTTTSITDQREEARKRVDGSHAKLLKNRSFPRDNGGRKRERTVHGAKNVESVRLVQCKDQMAQRIGNSGTRHRRDSGQNSFRRSRLPVTGADLGAARPVLSRSSSVRRTNRSASRIGTGPSLENGRRKMVNPVREGKWPSARESLENPLVSLECFIFI